MFTDEEHTLCDEETGIKLPTYLEPLYELEFGDSLNIHFCVSQPVDLLT